MKRFFLALLVLMFSSSIAQQEMGVLYDPKISAAPLNMSVVQRQKIVNQAIQFGSSTILKVCDSPTKWDGKSGILEARMIGSFTRPKSQQTAYVLSFPSCLSSHSDDDWRMVAIYEGSALKSGYLVASTSGIGVIDEFYAVKDVNQNGLTEIALVSSWADGGGGGTYLDLIDWSAASPKPLGSLRVAFGFADPNHPELHQYTVYVAKNAKPVFVGLEAGSKTQLTLLPLEKPNVFVIPIR
jgi:hypothetical protein